MPARAELFTQGLYVRPLVGITLLRNKGIVSKEERTRERCRFDEECA